MPPKSNGDMIAASIPDRQKSCTSNFLIFLLINVLSIFLGIIMELIAMKSTLPPKSIEDLMNRANNISGLSIGYLSDSCNISPPKNLKAKKGYIGQVIEIILGASAGNKPIPDFPDLGIELKTIPVDSNMSPIETTYVCTAPIPFRESNFENSVVLKKMSSVLWFPYISAPSINDCVLKDPVFWSPTQEQYATLKGDWEILAEMMGLGQFGQISSHIGTALQLRPKAANKKQTISVLDENGDMINIVPKGFYLRKIFTKQIIKNIVS